MGEESKDGGRPFARRRPCRGCPFSPSSRPGATGGSDASVFVGQAVGPFWLGCHEDPNYSQKTAAANTHRIAQCAGAAIFRANIGVDGAMPPEIHRLPADTSAAFAGPAELIAHHRRVTLAAAEEFLREFPPRFLLFLEAVKLELMRPFARR